LGSKVKSASFNRQDVKSVFGYSQNDNTRGAIANCSAGWERVSHIPAIGQVLVKLGKRALDFLFPFSSPKFNF